MFDESSQLFGRVLGTIRIANRMLPKKSKVPMIQIA